MDLSDNFQIHCAAYRMPGSWSTLPQIPRYWITIGKGDNQEIIWDFPAHFKEDEEVMRKLYFGEHIENISDLIAEYCQTPRLELKEKSFENDHYGLAEVLKKFDRRL